MKASRVFMMILSVALVLTLGFSAFLPLAQAQESTATIELTDPEFYQVWFFDNWPGGGGSSYLMETRIPWGQTIASVVPANVRYSPAPPPANLVFGSWNTQPDGSGDPLTVNTPIFSHMIVYAQWVTPASPTPPPVIPEEIEILPEDVPLAPAPLVVLPAPAPPAAAVLPAEEPPAPEEIEIPPDEVPLAPESPDEDEIDILLEEDLIEIEDEEVPLAPISVSGNWAITNLIISILGILIIPAVLIASKRRDEYEQSRTQKIVCLAVICAVAVTNAVVFFLTQDMSAAMIAADSWTILHAAMLVAQGITAALLFKRNNNRAPRAA